MGCASSTPMIATAGSEMLKAATHVAEDATKSAGDAVQDVTQSLGKTLDSTKETVGTAVTGFAHDLGNAFIEKTEALDEAKDNLLEKLHLGAGQQKQTEQETNHSTNGIKKTEVATAEQVAKKNDGDDGDDDDDDDDGAEEQTVERRLSRAPTPAHDVDSLKTSTPEPEIEQALAKYHEDSPPTPKPTLSELEHLNAEMNNDKDSIKKSKDESSSLVPVEISTAAEPIRPSTTDWEKYADQLSIHQKYIPADHFRRGVGSVGMAAGAVAGGVGKFHKFHGQQVHTPYIDYTTRPLGPRLRDDDSGLSDPNYNSYSSPLNSNRSSARAQRGAILPHTLTATNSKRFQREFASLVPFGNPSALRSDRKSPALGRKFDYNPHRSRVTTPLASRVLVRPQMTNSPKRKLTSRHDVQPELKTRSLSNTRAASKNSTATKSRPTSPAKPRSLSRSSRSSTNNSIAYKSSTCITPITARSPARSAMLNGACPSAPGRCTSSRSRCASPARSTVLRERSPTTDASSPGRRTPASFSRSPGRPMNTSPFLSSPRTSPFSIRKPFTEYSGDKENKPAFVADLSSVRDHRNTPTPSPYKVRERCAVCYNKYVIK